MITRCSCSRSRSRGRAPRARARRQAATGREAIATAIATRPNLAVLDIDMPDLGGLDVLQALHGEGLETRVLFVSGTLDADIAYQLVEAGAAGVLDKTALPDEIGGALIRIAEDETVLAPEVQAALVQAVRDRRERPATVLSPRETEVLGFLASGPERTADRARAAPLAVDDQDAPAAALRAARGLRPRGRPSPRACGAA
jgi:two-component system nitrate/nitrite response regulator NarL